LRLKILKRIGRKKAQRAQKRRCLEVIGKKASHVSWASTLIGTPLQSASLTFGRIEEEEFEQEETEETEGREL
jgi:hypothetical protein